MDAGIEKKVEAKERVEKRRIFRRISTDNNEFFRSKLEQLSPVASTKDITIRFTHSLFPIRPEDV